MTESTGPAVAGEEILAPLSRVKDPDPGRNIVDLEFVKDLKINGGNVSLAIEPRRTHGQQ